VVNPAFSGAGFKAEENIESLENIPGNKEQNAVNARFARDIRRSIS
jgi:hypothetical protein